MKCDCDLNYARQIKGLSFFTTFEGYKVVALNAGSVPSQLFDNIKKEYDLMMPFVFDGVRWVVNIYTKKDNIDVSEIAKKYGGGGHKKAAWFECDELPFVPEITP